MISWFWAEARPDTAPPSGPGSRSSRGALQRSLGGVCLNEGGIPSKALLNSAKIYESALHGRPTAVTVGRGARPCRGDRPQEKVVRTLVAGVKAKMKHAGVTVVEGEARLTGRTDEGFAAQCAGDTYAARRLLIATGSEPATPPIPGLREALASGFALTNREVLNLPAAPRTLPS